MKKKTFLRKAKKVGLKVYKNNIHKAKPLEHICGKLTAKHPVSIEVLVPGR